MKLFLQALIFCEYKLKKKKQTFKKQNKSTFYLNNVIFRDKYFNFYIENTVFFKNISNFIN